MGGDEAIEDCGGEGDGEGEGDAVECGAGVPDWAGQRGSFDGQEPDGGEEEQEDLRCGVHCLCGRRFGEPDEVRQCGEGGDGCCEGQGDDIVAAVCIGSRSG